MAKGQWLGYVAMLAIGMAVAFSCGMEIGRQNPETIVHHRVMLEYPPTGLCTDDK